MLNGNTDVLRLRDSDLRSLERLLAGYGLELVEVESGKDIPGSFWGESEAGLKQNTLFARLDTPLHSILHETCHYICMDDDRRSSLDTNAGGDFDEENAVCYLQILLADAVPGFGRARCMEDMDRWGYSFRLGSAKRWFEEDAEEARYWLEQRHLLPSPP
jgi:hypothetical protein